MSHANITVKATVPGCGKINVVSIYRPPCKPFVEFENFLSNILEDVGVEKSILAGDMNIDTIVRDAKPHTARYIELINSYGFVNVIDLPTYISPTSGTEKSCLDHIWHNFRDNYDSFVVQPSISDHYAVVCVFNMKCENEIITITIRDLSLANIENFKNKVGDVFINCKLTQQNANECAQYLDTFLRNILNKYFPLKNKILMKKRINSPWLTRDIIKCFDKKHEWFRIAKADRISYVSYRKYCNALRDLLRMAEEDYHVKRLELLKKDQKRNWAVLNALLGRKTNTVSDYFIIDGVEIHDPLTIANEFCNYFVNHPIHIQDDIPSSQNDYTENIPLHNYRFVLEHVTFNDVNLAIKKLKKEGPKNDLSVRFLKLCGLQLSRVLTKLFNVCIDEAVYPDVFKCSKISPVFKKGNRTHIEPHRPISVLCNLSKIFDSILHDRITNYFTRNGLLSAYQFGYREAKNTELAALRLVDRIIPAFQAGSYCICVFLDFSACFDTISRDILFNKLVRYGVQGPSPMFVKSYFNNRYQFVTFHGASSTILQQEIGIIQGSKLAPRFFDIYSNDMHSVLAGNEFVMYADDTAVVYVGDDLAELVNNVNFMLEKLVDWCRLRRYFNAASAKALYYSCVFSLITYCTTVWGGVLGCGSRGNELQKLHNRIIKNLFHHHSNSTNQCLFKEKKI